MDFPLISFAGEDTQYIAPTWDDMNDITFDIACQVRKAGIKPNRIVTLAKGGWPMTRSLVDFTGINQVASIGVKFYKEGINQRFETPRIYQELPVPMEGESILLFDDVADTGKSLEFVRDHLLKIGVREVFVASLFYKPHSVIKPDFHGPTTSSWIIFPYEIHEAYRFFRGKWSGMGLTDAQIDERMIQFGAKLVWLEEYKK